MNTKKILAAIAALSIVCGAFPTKPVAYVMSNTAVTAKAETTASDFDFDAETGTITKYNGTASKVVIPSEINGVAVNAIGDYAFSYCSSLSEVTIPESITSIGNYALADCYGLTSVTILGHDTKIGGKAFGYLRLFTDIGDYVGDDKLDNLKISGYQGSSAETYANENEFEFIALDVSEESPFDFDAETGTITKYNGTESKVVIPSEINGVAVTAIGESAFSACEILTEITIPESVTSIGDYAFLYCSSLSEIIIPDGVTSIGEGVFSKCSGLTKVTIPDSVTSIGEGAFAYCSGLSEIIIPDSVTGIGNGSFRECSGLTKITLPDSVTSIGYEAFISCSGLSEIIIPESVTSIGGYAFYDCKRLTEVTIPESVVSLGEYAFGFEYVDFSFVKKENFIIIGVVNSAAEAYAKEHEVNFDYIEIDDSGKCGENLTWVLGGNGVLTISGTGDMTNYKFEESPFYNNRKIKSIIFEDGITSIGDYAFYKCPFLTHISSFPDTLTKIGHSAFWSCLRLESLEGIVIPESVTLLDNRSFYDCPRLQKIIIENPKCDIYDDYYTITYKTAICGHDDSTAQAYAEKYGNKFISLDETPEFETVGTGYCGDDLVWTLDSNGTLTISGNGDMWNYNQPEASTGHSPFCSNKDIKSVVFEGYVSRISNWAFAGCSSLERITLPDTLRYIGSFSFGDCSALKEIYLPASLERINLSAFSGCSALKSVIIENPELEFKESENSITNAVICGYEGSTAQTYAEKYGLEFKAVKNRDIIKEGECGKNVRYSLNSDRVLTISGNGQIQDYNSPDLIAGQSPLFNLKFIKTAVIENGITKIGSWTFAGCSSLERITIENPECEIYDSEDTISNCIICGYEGSTAQAYAEKYGLEFEAIKPREIVKEGKCGDNASYTLDSDGLLVISGTGSIYNYSGNGSPFYNKKAIKNVVIESGITSIGNSAFDMCSAVESIKLPDSITSIGNFAFRGCSKLESISIPKAVASIGHSAFAGCSSLKNVVIPDGVTKIDFGTFNECENLESITLPEGLTSIEHEAFYGCTSLKAVKIPDSVTSIGYSAFLNCSSLAEVNIPDGIESIAYQTFENCPSLKEITIPESVEEIGYQALGYSFDEDFNITTTESFTIKGYKGSAAETYANENGFEFIAITNSILAGDSNCDGNVSLADAVLILQSIASPDVYGVNGTHENHITAQGSMNADVYENGSGLSAQDALQIQKYLIKLINKFD